MTVTTCDAPRSRPAHVDLRRPPAGVALCAEKPGIPDMIDVTQPSRHRAPGACTQHTVTVSL